METRIPPQFDRPPGVQVALLNGATLFTQMSNVAQTTVLGLLIYRRTGSELDLGFLGLAEFVPAAVLVLVAGAAADRFDRRRVAAASGLSNAAAALAMAWYIFDRPDGSTIPIFGLVLAFGAGQAFLAPAQRAIPPAMVDSGGLPWLTARRSIASQVGTIAGPASAGAFYGRDGIVPLVGAAVLSAVGAVLTLGIRHRATAAAVVESDERCSVDLPEESVSAPPGDLHNAMEGLRLVRKDPVLLGAISLDLFAVLLGGAITLLPAVAVRLDVGAVGVGWLRAAAGLGAAGATLIIALRPIRRHVGLVLLGAVAIFGAWTVVLGLTRSFGIAFVAIFALSAADAVSVFIRSTLVPLATPAPMRGRVLAVENVFIGASNELGGFESGALGQLLGTSGSVVLGGVGTLVVAVVWAVLFTPLRRIDRFPTAQ